MASWSAKGSKFDLKSLYTIVMRDVKYVKLPNLSKLLCPLEIQRNHLVQWP